MADKRDASSGFPWPPAIYGGSIAASTTLAWLLPWHFLMPEISGLRIVAGTALIVLGVAALVAAASGFTAAGTPTHPYKPTTAIVTKGIYRFTRNPMYLGMSLCLAGLGLTFDQVWFLLAVPFAVFAVTKLAIEREEAYLAMKFGAEYLTYKTQVRRWV